MDKKPFLNIRHLLIGGIGSLGTVLTSHSVLAIDLNGGGADQEIALPNDGISIDEPAPAPVITRASTPILIVTPIIKISPTASAPTPTAPPPEPTSTPVPPEPTATIRPVEPTEIPLPTSTRKCSGNKM